MAVGLGSALRAAEEQLEAAQVTRPRWNAECLLAGRLSCGRGELFLDSVLEVSADALIRFRGDVAARAAGVPLQYLLGTADFYGREFEVGPGVFIPRPETEILVETALDLLDEQFPSRGAESSRLKAVGSSLSQRKPTVVDIGTGCGAIAVTLALERPDLRLFGIDLSAMALQFARRNAQRRRVRIEFSQGDLLGGVQLGVADLLVANLPYLDPQSSGRWPKELHWEPWVSLDGGREGLVCLQALMRQAQGVLKPQGRLMLEIGAGQLPAASELAWNNRLQVERVVRDLAGIERVVVLQPAL